jgi:hypothetical protein
MTRRGSVPIQAAVGASFILAGALNGWVGILAAGGALVANALVMVVAAAVPRWRRSEWLGSAPLVAALASSGVAVYLLK